MTYRDRATMQAMRTTRPGMSVALACGLLLAVSAGMLALGAQPVRAEPDPGTRVGGKVVPATGVVTLLAGQKIETGAAPARIRTAANGELRVAPASVLSHHGVENGVESFFVVAGSVEGTITSATIVGAAPGWARCDAGSRATIRLGIPTDPHAARDSATFRALEGTVRIDYFAVQAVVSAGDEVTLSTGGDGPGSLAFAAAAGNRGSVGFERRSGDRIHEARVPAGVVGVLADRGAASRFVCRTAPRGSLISLANRPKVGPTRAGAIGPGAAAQLEGDTVRLEIAALGRGAVDRLRSTTAEFSTLANE